MNIWLEIKLISSQNHCQRFIDYGVAKNLALLFNWALLLKSGNYPAVW